MTIERSIAAVGCEIIQTGDGRLPVLAPISAGAGQMTVPIAAHLLLSSSGGRGILLGGSPGVPPANIVIPGAGNVGASAARTATAAGARVTVLDPDPDKLRRLVEHVPNAATCLSETGSVAATMAEADVVIGAVLVAGGRTPHVVSRAMVESMKPGSAILDIAIAIAQAMLLYLLAIAEHGVEEPVRRRADLARGIYTHGGACVSQTLREAWHAC